MTRTILVVDDEPGIVQIAREIDMNTVNLRAVYDIDPVDTWHSDSAVLVGDAAHVGYIEGAIHSAWATAATL